VNALKFGSHRRHETCGTSNDFDIPWGWGKFEILKQLNQDGLHFYQAMSVQNTSSEGVDMSDCKITHTQTSIYVESVMNQCQRAVRLTQYSYEDHC